METRPMDARHFGVINGEPVRLFNVYNTVAGLTGTLAKENSADRILVSRTICRAATPSNHKCGPRCLHAKGTSCECECGGKNHGAGK
jgi:hypothetical protein